MENNNLQVKPHPHLNILVREDGAIYNCGLTRRKRWTFGSKKENGYIHVIIDGKNYYVHRLVAETFIPNPEGKPTVDHINRDRSDNRVYNLRWATAKEQKENSSSIINRADYGVRWLENPKLYEKLRYQANIEKYREAARIRMNRRYHEGFTPKSRGLKNIRLANGSKWIPAEIAVELLKLPVSKRVYKPKED